MADSPRVGVIPREAWPCVSAVFEGPHCRCDHLSQHIACERIALLVDELDEAQGEVDELQATFDLCWKANMRAIKRWQEATGRDDTWPDHADLCVWLMEQLDAQKRTREVLAILLTETEDDWQYSHGNATTGQEMAREQLGLPKESPDV